MLIIDFFENNATETKVSVRSEKFSASTMEAEGYCFKNWFCEKNQNSYVFMSKDMKSCCIKLEAASLAKAKTFVYIINDEGKEFGVLK